MGRVCRVAAATLTATAREPADKQETREGGPGSRRHRKGCDRRTEHGYGSSRRFGHAGANKGDEKRQTEKYAEPLEHTARADRWPPRAGALRKNGVQANGDNRPSSTSRP